MQQMINRCCVLLGKKFEIESFHRDFRAGPEICPSGLFVEKKMMFTLSRPS